jgi:hypothetical protein
MAAMKRFYPATGTLEEWNAAYYRLEDYFRAHNVTNKVHQSQIILRLLERAAARHALCPDQPPTQLALDEAYAVMDRWFQRLLPDEPEQRAPSVGRVSMLIIDAPSKWPHVFLADQEEIPPEFRRALRETIVRSGPDLRVSSMVPRPLDAAPEEQPAEETWERLGRLSLAVLVGMLAVLGGAAFYILFQL